MTLAQALVLAAGLGLERLDAQLLLLHALGRHGSGRAWLVAHDTDVLDDTARARFENLCRQRADGLPVAYLTGHKEFFGLDLLVDPRVLIPRPDTETLVEWALDALAARPGGRACDLGTGSGAIALALKKTRPDLEVTAVDASPIALEAARANGARLGLEVSWCPGSWLEGIDTAFDVIVSNPPYIASGDSHLPALAHEPASALVSGPDGLDDIRAIIAQAPARLKPGGWLLLEHGHDQAAAVRSLLAAAGFGETASRRDLAGIERCSGGRLAGMK
jgi:release factor glutamine methyltransferase